MMHASRNRIIALNLISFLGQGSLYMMNLAFVYYIRYTIGASALAVGAAGAVYNLTYLIGCLLLIPRLSSFRKSRLIIAAYAGMGLSIGLLMMTRSLPLIYLCLAAYGAFMSLVWPSVEGWLTEGLEGRLLNKVLGFFSFSWSFGVAVSPIAATFLSSSNPIHALAAGEILFAIIIAIVICVSMKYGEMPYVERSYGEEGNGSGNDRRCERIMGWIGATAVYFALFITLNIFPMHALEGLGISEEASGLVLSLRGFVSCVFFVVLSRVSWWQRSRKRILLSQILLLISAMMMAENVMKELVSPKDEEQAEPEKIVNINDLLEELIAQSVALVGKPVALMNKEDKVRAIQFLSRSGAFLVTKSGDKIAKYFGISKYTLYSYIDTKLEA